MVTKRIFWGMISILMALTVLLLLSVTALAAAPVANGDTTTTDEDTPVTIDVLANDSDPDGDTLTVTSVTDPAHGTAAVESDGTITYTPDADFNGTDSFEYTVDDSNQETATALVTVTVNAVNDAPVAADDAYSVNEDEVLEVAAPGVLDNDTDAEGDSLTAVLVNGPSDGDLVLNGDGSFTYTPDPDFNGEDSFTYMANDGQADSETATVTITVDAVNDAPVAVITEIEDQVIPRPVTIKVTAQTLNLDRSGKWVKVHIKDDGGNTSQEMAISCDGSGSYDVDGDELSYDWTLTGPAGEIAISDAVSGQVMLPAGSYTLTLVVNDGTVDSEAALETFVLTDDTLSGLQDALPDEFTLNGVAGSEVKGKGHSLTVSFDSGDVQAALSAGLDVEMVLGGRAMGEDDVDVIQGHGKSGNDGPVAVGQNNGLAIGKANAPGQNK